MSSYNSTPGVASGVENWQKYEMGAFGGPAIEGGKKAVGPFNRYAGQTPRSGAFRPLHEKNIPGNAEPQPAGTLPGADDGTDAIEQEAYAKGFEQGEKDGLEYGRQKVAKVLDKMENILLEMHQAKQSLLKKGEKELLDIVFAVSRKIVRTQTSIDCDTVRSTVLEAIRYAADKSRLTIRIHPDDHQYIATVKPELFERSDRTRQISIMPDPSINRGGCLVNTSCGNVDATVDTQLEKIREAVASVYQLQAGN